MKTEEKIIHKFLDLIYNPFRGKKLKKFRGLGDLIYVYPENEEYFHWFYYKPSNKTEIIASYPLVELIASYIPIEEHMIRYFVISWTKKNIII